MTSRGPFSAMLTLLQRLVREIAQDFKTGEHCITAELPLCCLCCWTTS